jgi:two-component system, LytTR family, sensor histidine kinase AlgZ
MPRNWPMDILKFIGFALLVTAIAAAISPSLAASGSYIDIAVFFLFTLIIGGLSWAIMPPLGAWTENKPLLFRWTILVSALMGTGTAGTAIASAIGYYGFGGVEGGASPLHLFSKILSVALPVTVVVGVITTVIVAGKGRLETSRMALQTQRLERERAEKLAAEAQLASLASRVQPHFLFNTLNSISALIRENPAQAEQTIERLASLLRSSLDSTETVPLEHEMKLVRDYLDIQKTRQGERLTYEISVAPGLSVAVPPFSVQTLVENAVKHVGARRQEGVDLEIRVSPINGEVVVFVTDNGPGFDPSSIKAGHGLDNLQGRLRAVCGDRAGLEFFREPGRMTVRLRIPRVEGAVS